MQEDLQERQRRAERIESLIQEVNAFRDPHARAVTEELLQALLDMYGEGLARILELTIQSETTSYALVKMFMSDDLLGSLLLLHDLHPIPIETRVTQALDEVRPYLKSHGGNVELLKVEDNVAHLRLEGSCHGCPSSTMTLKLTIEEAIYKVAPDLDDLVVEGVADPPRPPVRAGQAGTPVAFIPRHQKDAPPSSSRPKTHSGGWTTVNDLHSLPHGTLKAISVEQEPLIFCKLGETYYAYYNRCNHCQQPLDSSSLAGNILTCAFCKQQYDLYHAGRSVDSPNLFLRPIPLLIEEGKVKVTLPASAGNKAALSASVG